MSDVVAEFAPGHTGKACLTSFYAGGAHVPAGTRNGAGHAIPSSGKICLQSFYGASAAPPLPQPNQILYHGQVSSYGATHRWTVTVPNDGHKYYLVSIMAVDNGAQGIFTGFNCSVPSTILTPLQTNWTSTAVAVSNAPVSAGKHTITIKFTATNGPDGMLSHYYLIPDLPNPTSPHIALNDKALTHNVDSGGKAGGLMLAVAYGRPPGGIHIQTIKTQSTGTAPTIGAEKVQTRSSQLHAQWWTWPDAFSAVLNTPKGGERGQRYGHATVVWTP